MLLVWTERVIFIRFLLTLIDPRFRVWRQLIGLRRRCTLCSVARVG
jgi:hypothetical protein